MGKHSMGGVFVTGSHLVWLRSFYTSDYMGGGALWAGDLISAEQMPLPKIETRYKQLLPISQAALNKVTLVEWTNPDSEMPSWFGP